jgi:hypothetical protein
MGSNLATNLVEESGAQNLAAHFWQVNNVVTDYYNHLEQAEQLQSSASLKRKSVWLKVPSLIRLCFTLTLILFGITGFGEGYAYKFFNPDGDVKGFLDVVLMKSLVIAFLLSAGFAFLRFKAHKSKIDKEADGIQASAKAEMDVVNNIAQSNKELISSVPANYRYPMATNYIYEVFRDGRVNTLNEALNMYDTQLHRWKMEKMGEKMLTEQQRQTNIMKVIAANTEWSDFGATLDWLFL